MYQVIELPKPGGRSLLERFVFSGIVFNMSWEDPEMDRRAFCLTPADTVVSITSAGCNPLNFLYQSPKRVLCVDGNPAQNALMELKLATIATCDHDTFFDIFAARAPRRVLNVYRPRLRAILSDSARDFWDRNLWKAADGVYNHGRTGLFCRIMRKYLALIGIDARTLDGLFQCNTLAEQQAYYYAKIAPRLWGTTSKLFVAFKPFLYLAGVHPEQFKLVDGRHDMYAYVKERLEYLLTQVPIKNNYFLSATATGRFRGHHVPPYLLPQHFATLRKNLDRVLIVNGWLGPFLDSQPAGSITKFNLLDIFDWMPPHLFEATLQSVLRAAAPDSTMIYRSGSYLLEPPESIRPHIQHHPELSRELLAIDRSGTYGSFYVYTVHPVERAGRETAAPQRLAV